MGRTRRLRCKRNQRGGGLGGGWEFQPTPTGNIVNNEIAWNPIGNCRATDLRPGFMPNGFTGPKGLPGMSGGKRRGYTKKNYRKGRKNSKGKKRSTRKRGMYGGRYAIGKPDGAGMGTPWGSGIPPTMRVPCEASRTAIPPDNASDTLNKRGSANWDGPVPPPGDMAGMSGGAYTAQASAASSLNVANPNSEFYVVPKAGYTHLEKPSDVIYTAAGTLEMINIPENARMMNPACLKTGGGRRRRRSRKGKGRK
jgi:hypothetical protein